MSEQRKTKFYAFGENGVPDPQWHVWVEGYNNVETIEWHKNQGRQAIPLFAGAVEEGEYA